MLQKTASDMTDIENMLERARICGAALERLRLATEVERVFVAALDACTDITQRIRLAAIMLRLQDSIAVGLAADEAWVKRQQEAEAKCPTTSN